MQERRPSGDAHEKRKPSAIYCPRCASGVAERNDNMKSLHLSSRISACIRVISILMAHVLRGSLREIPRIRPGN